MRPGRARPTAVFAVLAVAAGLYSLMQSMTVPALPVLQRELNSDQGVTSWVLTAFLVAASIATPIAGRAGDLYGRRLLLVISLALLAAGSALAAAAPSMSVLIAGRAVQGCSGGILPLAFGILRDEITPRRLPQAIAVISSLMAVGFAVGVVVSGYVVDHLGFRWLFVLPGGVAVVAAMIVPIVVPPSTRGGVGAVNLLSAALFAGWLLLLLVGLSQAPQRGWLSPPFLLMIAAAVLVFVGWAMVEMRARVPLVDLRLMRTREIAAPNLVALLIGTALFGAFGFIPQLLQTPISEGYGFGATVAESGVMMLPSAVASFIAGLLAARLAAANGLRAMIAFGCGSSAAGLMMLAVWHAEPWHVYVATSLNSFGTAVVFACLANAVVAASPKESVGMATSMNANIRTVGGSVGTAVIATVLAAAMLPSGFPSERGYTVAFLVLAATAALAALASLLLAPGRGERAGRDD